MALVVTRSQALTTRSGKVYPPPTTVFTRRRQPRKRQQPHTPLSAESDTEEEGESWDTEILETGTVPNVRNDDDEASLLAMVARALTALYQSGAITTATHDEDSDDDELTMVPDSPLRSGSQTPILAFSSDSDSD